MINATISRLRGRSLAFLVAATVTGAVFVGALSMPVAAESTQPYPACSATLTDECQQVQPGQAAMHRPAAHHAIKHRTATHRARATGMEGKAQ